MRLREAKGGCKRVVGMKGTPQKKGVLKVT